MKQNTDKLKMAILCLVAALISGFVFLFIFSIFYTFLPSVVNTILISVLAALFFATVIISFVRLKTKKKLTFKQLNFSEKTAVISKLVLGLAALTYMFLMTLFRESIPSFVNMLLVIIVMVALFFSFRTGAQDRRSH